MDHMPRSEREEAVEVLAAADPPSVAMLRD